jgi:hypothetical protein
LVGIALLVSTSEPFYPLSQWLLWHYLAVIGLSAFALLAAFSLGDWLLRRVFRLCLPTHERLTLGLGLGLIGFEIGLFLLGVFNAYGSVTFFVYPSALLLLTVTEWRNHARRAAKLWKQGPRLTLGQVAFVLFGCATIALIYFSILTPQNVQFDARWKHMALAEDYVAHGGLRRMPEGWVFAARPHLTSFLYVWAFMLPVGSLFHRMELCAHLEFFVFLATTFFGIPAVVRRLIPRIDPRIIWVARFLFPGVLLYDSSLTSGADHFGALLAPAIAVGVLRSYRTLDRRWVLALIVLLAGAAITKETVAIMLVPVPVLVLGLRSIWLICATQDRSHTAQRLIVTLSSAVALGLVTTAPFWFVNIIWYGNPVYPSLSNVFPSHPWSDIAAYRFNVEYSDTNMWSPERNTSGIIRSLLAVFDFSFIPNDWSRFHGKRPVFGSLFTLLVPVLFWLRGTKRIWAIVGWLHIAIFTWYWVHHQDRYLQAIVPLMAACTAATLVLIYRLQHRWIRALTGGLVALQLALGADVYFIATHAMTGSAVKRSVDFLSMGYQGKYQERFSIEPRWVALSNTIPKGARILFHDVHTHLGSEHEGVRDLALWQSGLNYSLSKHPEDVYRWLKDKGVTHIVTIAGKSTGNDRLASDLVFYDYVYRRAKRLKDVEGLHVFELIAPPKDVPYRDKVVVVSCGPTNSYELRNLKDLSRPGIGPLSYVRRAPITTTTDSASLFAMYAEADFVVVGAKCEAPPGMTAQFKKIAERPKRGSVPAYTLYLRQDVRPVINETRVPSAPLTGSTSLPPENDDDPAFVP